MGTPRPTQQQLIIEKLLAGKQSATLLQTLLRKPVNDRGSVSVEELSGNVVRSFTEGLSILSFHGPGNERTQIVLSDGSVRACLSNRSSKTSDGIRKRPVSKGRRGCHKRRNASDSRIIDSFNQEDDFAWRKYGQKEILNSKFPRCYFRCTHKHDQGCMAIKQVQAINDHPLTYRTTYIGVHTCNPMRAPPIISGGSDPSESCLISFETNKIPIPTPTPTKKSDSLCSGIFPSSSREDTQSDISDNQSLWQGFMNSDQFSAPPSAPTAKMTNYSHHHDQEVLSSSLSSDNTCTSTTLPHDLDMDQVFSKLDDLDDLFRD